jgi:tetratricopeptide (TPR) repeat protein
MLSALFFCGLCFGVPQANEAAAKSQRANQLMAAGKFEEAIPLYKQLLQSAPGNPGLVLNLALAEHMAGHEREAIPHFEAVLKTQPNLVPALLSLGAARLALNEPQLAIAPLQKAVAADARNLDARGMLASALMDAGRFEQASEQYRKLTAVWPEDPRAWYGLGMSYQSIAIHAFDKLQKIDPKSPYVSALVGDTRVQRGQYRSAFFFYREALKQLPELHGIHAALAGVYRKTGHSDWAAHEDNKERALPAPDCRTHPRACEFLAGHDLQAATVALSDNASAEALFWQAKAANELALQAFFRLGQLPPSVEVHQLKAEIARNRNQHLESVKEWRAALELAPGNPRLKHELTVSLFLAQNYADALREAEALLDRNARSPELNFIAGTSLLRLEQPEKSIPYLRAALAADPKLTAAEASLGLALSRLDRNAEAVSHLEKALDLDDDGSLHYQLARAYQAAGDVEKARVAMAQYQDIQKKNEEQKREVAREAQIAPPQ